jgi:hypothetical protein
MVWMAWFMKFKRMFSTIWSLLGWFSMANAHMMHWGLKHPQKKFLFLFFIVIVWYTFVVRIFLLYIYLSPIKINSKYSTTYIFTVPVNLIKNGSKEHNKESSFSYFSYWLLVLGLTSCLLFRPPTITRRLSVVTKMSL